VEFIFSYLFIFFARVIDMGLSVLRILMLMRGKAWQAALTGFFESLVYILALSQVFSNIDDPIKLVLYALGFATGNWVGALLEEKMAVGYTNAQVISMADDGSLVAKLRDQGFGVTVLEGYGKDGPHDVLSILMPRKQLNKFLKFMHQFDKDAFITVADTRRITGGYFRRMKRK